MKKILRCFATAFVAIIVFLGINLSHRKIIISGEHANITLVSLGTQAQAYCNELTGPEVADGVCVGRPDDINTRCMASNGTCNCLRN